MDNKKAKFKLLLTILVILLISYLSYKKLINISTCKIEGGWSGIIQECECFGKEVTISDKRAVDGVKKTICIGRITNTINYISINKTAAENTTN